LYSDLIKKLHQSGEVSSNIILTFFVLKLFLISFDYNLIN